jgi:hypothetical protein
LQSLIVQTRDAASGIIDLLNSDIPNLVLNIQEILKLKSIPAKTYHGIQIGEGIQQFSSPEKIQKHQSTKGNGKKLHIFPTELNSASAFKPNALRNSSLIGKITDDRSMSPIEFNFSDR